MTATRLAPGTWRALAFLAALLSYASPVVLDAQTTERELYVSVLDADGRPVPDLTPEAFVVREDGLRREVLRVSRATAPMQIAVLVDTSQAATRPMKEIREAIADFVTRMHQNNEIALITFGERPLIRVDYTSSLSTLEAGIGRLFGRPGSGAYLIDAMAETLRGIRRRDAARPVILAVTTEGIEYSTTYYRSVLNDLRESRAAFHALVVEDSPSSRLDNQAARERSFLLAEGTQLSGGRRDELLTSMALEETLHAIAEDLSSQYLLVYARPASLIPPDSVEVTSAAQEFEARGTPVRRGEAQ